MTQGDDVLTTNLQSQKVLQGLEADADLSFLIPDYAPRFVKEIDLETHSGDDATINATTDGDPAEHGYRKLTQTDQGPTSHRSRVERSAISDLLDGWVPPEPPFTSSSAMIPRNAADPTYNGNNDFKPPDAQSEEKDNDNMSFSSAPAGIVTQMMDLVNKGFAHHQDRFTGYEITDECPPCFKTQYRDRFNQLKTTQLMKHQREGIVFALHLRSNGYRGYCLADEPGTGKTHQIIALLFEAETTPSMPHLLVVPAALMLK